MKNAKWLLAFLPLSLLMVGRSVSHEREGKRVRMVQAEFKRAVENEDTQQMIHWLHLGANPNVSTNSGWLALDYAVSQFEPTLVQAFLDARVDVNRRNALGEPPLASAINVCGSCACLTNDTAAISLLNHGARAEVSYKGRTPLLDSAKMVQFASEENLHLIPILLKRGANPLHRNEKGRTAYDIVARAHVDPEQEKQRRHVLALLKTAIKEHHA